MSTQEVTGTHWIEAARYAVEHHSFVMVEQDGSWRTPTDRDHAALDHALDDANQLLYGDPPVTTTGVMLDAFTASMLVQIYDKVNDENRARLHAMDLLRAVDVGWKIVERTRA